MGIVGRVVAPCFPVGRRLFDPSETVSETVNGIAPRERRLLELLRENPAITLDVSYTTVWRTFRAMQEAKLIERTGSDRRGTWRILTPPQLSHE